MTIDERLEALTQTVELLSTLHRDNDKRIERMSERIEALAQNMELLGTLHQDNEKRMAQMMDAITRLAHIANAHQERLDDHGERIERLEGGPPHRPRSRPRRS